MSVITHLTYSTSVPYCWVKLFILFTFLFIKPISIASLPSRFRNWLFSFVHKTLYTEVSVKETNCKCLFAVEFFIREEIVRGIGYVFQFTLGSLLYAQLTSFIIPVQTFTKLEFCGILYLTKKLIKYSMKEGIFNGGN